MSFRFDVQGLDKMQKGAGVGARMLAEVWREILRGPFGQELLDDLRARTGDNANTGRLVSSMSVEDDGAEGVEIGVGKSVKNTRHGTERGRPSVGAVGTWLESGTKMHMIPNRVEYDTPLRIGGSWVQRVAHPGTRAARPMYKTLRVFRGDGERLLEKELNRRLGNKMGLS